MSDIAWHAAGPAEVARNYGTDPAEGLTEAEAVRRRGEHGPNRLPEAQREPRWHAFLRQFQDLLILTLIGAALVSLLVTGEWETPAIIVLVVLLNATIGFVQESKAEASLEALQKMLHTEATVLRDGSAIRLDAADLVPGDIVELEAGARVPADGRLLSSASLEVQEAALTGEAEATAKSAEAEVAPDAPLADRVTSVFMNTIVTRGHARMIVTATGAATEIGQIAGLIQETEPAPTPLQRQINALGKTLALIAGVVIVIVFVLGLLRGQPVGDLFITSVSLAVATVPEGLPAVVAFTLAMGTARLARRGAIVKRLASVETLGSTSQICTDKTGTLTLNQMTAREVRLADRRFTVSGQGYSAEGRIRSTDDSPAEGPALHEALVGMALCTDALVHGEDDVVGDPTELALVVLAEKGGVDVTALRRRHPRIAEVPFDSDDKFMAVFHQTGDRVRCFVKGAPDVLAARADRYLTADGTRYFDVAARERYADGNRELAEQGLRVLAIGVKDLPGLDAETDLKGLVDGIVMLALVGIVDPPRPEAAEAIAQCHQAGIQVRMITGDHAVTAAAIARQLNIPGKAITGAELDSISDEELARELPEIGVVARVTPQHKIRIVQALQDSGQVVAMTGDGVNDAPALRKADIGVAMGITGTEVSKEAATMILTDDNFTTVVDAVREGRGIYANIVKFTRFQLSTAFGFVLTFLAASLTGLAGGAPFTAVQILFVNLVMDGPPALSLGVDPAGPDAMKHPPRPRDERILTTTRLLRILLAGAVMSGGTLAVLILAPGHAAAAGQVSVAGTMAFVTFVFFQIFNLINVRDDLRSAFHRSTFANPSTFVAIGVVLVLLVAMVEWPALHAFFTVTNLTAGQWLVCAAVGSAILWAGELVKFILRRRT
ncbi:calcium-translocating P-type ATPase, PMCA-type [Streptosporangium sp. NBC_01755]|uniref:calcium-translocating P-type ATPase, PMCA-type n=1 Tax=unclassified Streptosporangium TaxID=2632669 RepID=UPI002DD9A239|nr:MULTISPECIES: calcium-translocating P-type ATPase, PMCA-type [unclassified Streptosporangium]WSA23978.1 calcium-translocating P-type ATPase, PMCA-type [Streptosporangium sp. NBC_01810]WSC97946.1 calcium-translocating P-type ATPase, PMCA-type [Streptosporangium sp. NBC_01755]